jgi:2-methylisocitrate lyase-like PEP mutase family enzyme
LSFFEALKSKDEAKKVCQIMGNVLVLLNMVPGGTTLDMTAEEARELGFRIVIFPTICLSAVASSVGNALDDLQGRIGEPPSNDPTGVKSLFNICGLQDCIELDKKAGGQAYADVGK